MKPDFELELMKNSLDFSIEHHLALLCFLSLSVVILVLINFTIKYGRLLVHITAVGVCMYTCHEPL